MLPMALVQFGRKGREGEVRLGWWAEPEFKLADAVNVNGLNQALLPIDMNILGLC